mgnify:CR=1 FL=1|jgi:hypothetical protein|tara:strand:+ start:1062 stop:1472 length:411 start_codon:yes stop_codon:yes gene_type:complete
MSVDEARSRLEELRFEYVTAVPAGEVTRLEDVTFNYAIQLIGDLMSHVEDFTDYTPEISVKTDNPLIKEVQFLYRLRNKATWTLRLLDGGQFVYAVFNNGLGAIDEIQVAPTNIPLIASVMQGYVEVAGLEGTEDD